VRPGYLSERENSEVQLSARALSRWSMALIDLDPRRAGVEARGRRRAKSSSRPAGTDPGEGDGRGPAAGEGGRLLFEGEACAKGTALVAKTRANVTRDPRPRAGASGGSSGGRAQITRNSSERGPCAKNPKSGAECEVLSARSNVEQNVRVVETAKAQSAGPGGPARCELEVHSSALRTLRAIKNAEGKPNPMRGGSTHWAGRGAERASWMSTGRPRAKC
jgi:hypothetical protein